MQMKYVRYRLIMPTQQNENCLVRVPYPAPTFNQTCVVNEKCVVNDPYSTPHN